MSVGVRFGHRNTPTCVGKTIQQQIMSLPLQKHPHVRGEDISTTDAHHSAAETPPRAWGRRSAAMRSMGL